MTEMAPEDQGLLREILGRVEHFEQTLGSHYRDGVWARMEKLYHSWTQLRAALRGTRGRDRDAVYKDAMDDFGHELFIPHAFAITETVLPALISNRPRILVVPAGEASPNNCKNMKAMIDKQQSNISMELRLQSVAKSALKLGIGIGQSYWLRREGQRVIQKELVSWHPARALGKTHYVETLSEPLFDDPTFEFVRAPDFGWDVFASNIDDARCAWKRTWRDTGYVRTRLEDGSWDRMKLGAEDYENTGRSGDLYVESVRGQFDAQTIPIPTPGLRTGMNDIHEVLEYHDRGQIVTVLNRMWIVSVVQNEVNYGRLPFHIFRPTEIEGQFVGKGEIEPIEDLQREMNAMRTDRRWSDLMALNPVLFYNDGMIDPDQIKVGPGELNPVNGDPKDIIWQLNLTGPQASSYRETAEIATDIVRASGISDTFAGGEAGSQATATGTQLQLARASVRIQNKTRRLELEMVKPVGEHWVRMNQRHITGQRDVAVPAPPQPGQPERAWAQVKLGPNELAGKFDIEIEGGSTTPENVPQKRQDAQIKMTLLTSPAGQLLDPRQTMISILEDLGFKNPESMMNAGAVVPPEALELIVQNLAAMGVDPMVAQQLVQESVHQALEMKDEMAQAADHGQGGEGGQEQSPPEQQAA